MTRRLKEPVEKICPKCKKTFITDRPRRFCSPKCSQAREWTPEQNKARSIAKRESIMSDTDAAEEERWRVRKDKCFPPPIVHPDDLHLKQNQFISGGEIWTEVEDWRNILSF